MKFLTALLTLVLATPAVAIETGAAYQVLRAPSGGGRMRAGAVDISQSAAVTGVLGRSNGGTGISSSGSAYEVYRNNSGGTGGMGSIDISQSAAVTGVLKPANGGDTPPNKLINGNMDLWQRGTTFGTGSGARYTADRWQVSTTGTTNSVDRTTFSPGQTDVPNEPTHNLQMTVTSSAGASNFAKLQQYVEDVRTCAGQTCTFSFWAKANASRTIAMEFVQSFGTGGSPSADVSTIGVNTFALTTTWTKYSATISVPSISGKTIGSTANTSYLQVSFWLDCGSTFASRCGSIGQQSGVYNFTSVSLVQGSNSPDVFQRAGGSFFGEVALAERYYEKSYALDTVPGTATGAGSVTNQCRIANSTTADHCHLIQYRVRKRIVPTISVWNNSGTSNQWRDSDNNSLAVTADNSFDIGFAYGTTATSGRTIGQAFSMTGQFTADAEF